MFDRYLAFLLAQPSYRAPAPKPGENPASDLRRLGELLKSRTEDVLRLTDSRIDGEVDAVVQESFERTSRSSTVAVARWMAGEDLQVAREAGEETWLVFGDLAARREVSLNALVARCLAWRDAMAEVLRHDVSSLGLTSETLIEALNILQLSLEFSLVRMCECFETERRRHDRGCR